MWIHGPLVDNVMGWCWLPIAVALHALERHPVALRSMIGIIFLVSFAHQPLTLGLVYGDPAQRRSRRTLYSVAPFAAAGVVILGVHVSLTMVAVIAGLWNAEHTLMQRYGVMRIYGRKVGDSNGALEKPMLIAWLLTALTYLGGYVDLKAIVARIDMGGTNANSVHQLDRVSSFVAVLFWPSLIVSAVLATRWVLAERAAGRANTLAKHWYVAATFGLVIAVVVDPIAGVFGYIAAHSIEYFGIVHSSLRRRAATGDPSPIARATSSAARRAVVYASYAIAIGGMIYVSWTFWDGKLYAFLVLFFGALHILYDGFVWKLRRPATAASLGIVIASAT
jgi:uncharacterized membrane protein YidH (DUF202 family)